MIMDLTRLKSSIDEYIEIDELVPYEQEYAKNTELLDLKHVTVKGNLYKDSAEQVILDVILKGVMVLPCSITLKPVDYEFECSIQGSLEDLYQEIDKNGKKYENSIDILPIIWENILMEMPMKVVSDDISDAKTEGEGWRLITEKEDTYINPELEKLKDLLD